MAERHDRKKDVEEKGGKWMEQNQIWKNDLFISEKIEKKSKGKVTIGNEWRPTKLWMLIISKNIKKAN